MSWFGLTTSTHPPPPRNLCITLTRVSSVPPHPALRLGLAAHLRRASPFRLGLPRTDWILVGCTMAYGGKSVGMRGTGSGREASRILPWRASRAGPAPEHVRRDRFSGPLTPALRELSRTRKFFASVFESDSCIVSAWHLHECGLGSSFSFRWIGSGGLGRSGRFSTPTAGYCAVRSFANTRSFRCGRDSERFGHRI